MRTALLSLLLAALVVGGGLQLVPLEFERDNPPAPAPLEGPADVLQVLRRACYDCHSNETRWPWYAWIAPLSWGVTEDVAGARSRMNFSEWGNLREGIRRRQARKVVERIQAGEMPMPRYLWLHPSARIAAGDLKRLIRWRDSLESP